MLDIFSQYKKRKVNEIKTSLYVKWLFHKLISMDIFNKLFESFHNNL